MSPESELRKRFEKWVSSVRFGDVWLQRIPERTTRSGEYYSEAVELAWQAWREADRQTGEKEASE